MRHFPYRKLKNTIKVKFEVSIPLIANTINGIALHESPSILYPLKIHGYKSFHFARCFPRYRRDEAYQQDSKESSLYRWIEQRGKNSSPVERFLGTIPVSRVLELCMYSMFFMSSFHPLSSRKRLLKQTRRRIYPL